MTVPAIYKKGDRVLIEAGSRTVSGTILIASPNGVSLMLQFEAMIGGHVGMMPVMHQADDCYASIMDGQTVRLKRPTS